MSLVTCSRHGPGILTCYRDSIKGGTCEREFHATYTMHRLREKKCHAGYRNIPNIKSSNDFNAAFWRNWDCHHGNGVKTVWNLCRQPLRYPFACKHQRAKWQNGSSKVHALNPPLGADQHHVFRHTTCYGSPLFHKRPTGFTHSHVQIPNPQTQKWDTLAEFSTI